ncbi:hypothetical protein [Halalkalibacter flavus]|uniref:hypothetical protein n=1 Tax=Halalkalibacter flavus TaxID=3090668 RepID=UPI002FC83B5F
MRVLFYCDVDEEGNIIESIAGELKRPVIPEKQWDEFFLLDSWDIPNNIQNYKVVDRQLVLK